MLRLRRLCGRRRVELRIDVNVGDPVTPAPTIVSYPAPLGPSFPLVDYPIEAVLAEKLVTMVARGDATTRDRDFADVLLLAGHHALGGLPLRGLQGHELEFLLKSAAARAPG